MEVINMNKTPKINMAKENGESVSKLFVGLRWDKNRFSNEKEADLDVVGFLTDENRKCKFPSDLVNHQNTDNYGTTWDWCELSEDNMDGDDSKGITFSGEHYDEYMIIDTDKIPADRSDFYICMTIYRAIQRLQKFDMIDNVQMHIYDYNAPDKFKATFDLSEDEKFSSLNAVELGRLYRYNGKFKFQALGRGYINGASELFKTFGFNIDEGKDLELKHYVDRYEEFYYNPETGECYEDPDGKRKIEGKVFRG